MPAIGVILITHPLQIGMVERLLLLNLLKDVLELLLVLNPGELLLGKPELPPDCLHILAPLINLRQEVLDRLLLNQVAFKEMLEGDEGLLT